MLLSPFGDSTLAQIMTWSHYKTQFKVHCVNEKLDEQWRSIKGFKSHVSQWEDTWWECDEWINWFSLMPEIMKTMRRAASEKFTHIALWFPFVSAGGWAKSTHIFVFVIEIVFLGMFSFQFREAVTEHRGLSRPGHNSKWQDLKIL